MSAVEALKAARAAGIELALDGDDLALSAASAPPAAVLDALSRHKAEIVALLRPTTIGWTPEDSQNAYEERAATNMTVVLHALGLRRWPGLDPVQAPSDTPPMRNETTTEGGKRFCRNTRHVEAPLHERRNT